MVSESTKVWVNIGFLVFGSLVLVGIVFYLFAAIASPPGIIAACRPGLTETSKGHCVKTFGEPCSITDDCDEHLFCHSGKCACRLEDQTYSAQRNSCISKIGGPCNIPEHSCPDHSFCKFFSNEQHGICECNLGFLVNGEGQCEAAYNTPCSASVPCDVIAGLACVNGVCECKKFGQYDILLRSCLGLIGSRCDSKSSQEVQCVKHAECTSSHPKLIPTCSCKAGYIVTPDYTCV